MYGFIYLITNTINGKIYVGQTKRTVEKRWKGHLSKARHTEEATPILCAIRKYGADNFSQKVLCVADNKQQLDKLEENYTILLKSNDNTIGYNLAVGACVKGEPRERSNRKQTGKLSHKYRNDIKDEDVISLYSSGLLQREVAEKLGTSVFLVQSRLKANNVNTRPDPRKKIPLDYQDMCEEYLLGATLKEIGTKRDLAYQVVKRILQGHGILIRKPLLPIKDVIRLYEEGMSTTELQAKYGVDCSTISARLRKHGVRIRSRVEAWNVRRNKSLR